MPAAVKLQAYPDREFKGRVREIFPSADRAKAIVEVRVTILDADRRREAGDDGERHVPGAAGAAAAGGRRVARIARRCPSGRRAEARGGRPRRADHGLGGDRRRRRQPSGRRSVRTRLDQVESAERAGARAKPSSSIRRPA